jgi:colanic acid/amylovoran biosynthesis glycosyltransferase
VSIMEAMSHSIPTIATAVGGTPEIVDEASGTGFLLPQDVTPEQVAQKISNFYRLPKREKEEMREKAYLKWLTTFNAEKNYREFSDFLEELSRQR